MELQQRQKLTATWDVVGTQREPATLQVVLES